jgi:hypothetical protein
MATYIDGVLVGGGSSDVARQKPTIYVPGEQPYVRPGWAGYLTGTVNTLAGAEEFGPIYVSRTTSYDRIGLWVQSEVVGLARLGIYNADADLQPSSLVLDAGTVDLSTTGAKELTIDQDLDEGYYFLVAVANAVATMYCFDATAAVSMPVTAKGTNISVMADVCLVATGQVAHVAGGLPATAVTPNNDRDVRYIFTGLREVI